MSTLNDDIRYIADNYGMSHQVKKTIEELTELSLALMRYEKNGDVEFKNVISEIADVHIMLEQIEYLLDISDEMLMSELKHKVARTLKLKEREEGLWKD